MKRINHEIPEKGKVQVLPFTDEQYEDIVSFQGGKAGAKPNNPSQFQKYAGCKFKSRVS